MPQISQTAQCLLLGRELRALRESVGLTQAQAAVRIGTQTSTLNRVERGRRHARVPVLRGALRLYGVDAKTTEDWVRRAQAARTPGWHADHKGVVPDWFRRYLGLELAALHKASYESEFVPGLLQIPPYTQAVAAACRVGGPSDSAANVLAVLSSRHQRLLDPANPLTLAAVLNEAVIRRLVGGREVMREQLAYLVTMATRRNISLRVLPFATREHPAMTGSFTLLQFSQETINTVYIEQADGAIYVDRPDDVQRYQTIFAHLSGLAASEEETITMIDRVREEL